MSDKHAVRWSSGNSKLTVEVPAALNEELVSLLRKQGSSDKPLFSWGIREAEGDRLNDFIRVVEIEVSYKGPTVFNLPSRLTKRKSSQGALQDFGRTVQVIEDRRDLLEQREILPLSAAQEKYRYGSIRHAAESQRVIEAPAREITELKEEISSLKLIIAREHTRTRTSIIDEIREAPRRVLATEMALLGCILGISQILYYASGSVLINPPVAWFGIAALGFFGLLMGVDSLTRRRRRAQRDRDG